MAAIFQGRFWIPPAKTHMPKKDIISAITAFKGDPKTNMISGL